MPLVNIFHGMYFLHYSESIISFSICTQSQCYVRPWTRSTTIPLYTTAKSQTITHHRYHKSPCHWSSLFRTSSTSHTTTPSKFSPSSSCSHSPPSSRSSSSSSRQPRHNRPHICPHYVRSFNREVTRWYACITQRRIEMRFVRRTYFLQGYASAIALVPLPLLSPPFYYFFCHSFMPHEQSMLPHPYTPHIRPYPY